jgi:hypothetical protein
LTGANAHPRPKIIVFGILFWYPLAGVTYQFLHYLLGLRRLGYDPYYVEDSGRYVYDPKLNDLTPDAASNIAAVTPLLEAFGFKDRWCFRGKYPGGQCYGMSEAQLLQLYSDAEAFLNVTGAQEIREEHRIVPRRIYVESDPFVAQAKLAMGDQAVLAQLGAHDMHFSFGENLGAPDCTVPTGIFNWQPTRQPVVMDLWRHEFPPGDAYNTITTWHNKGKNLVYQGETYYWTKDREFEKILDLPTRRNVKFELATSVDPNTDDRLRALGWRRVDSVGISRDIDSYRTYIQRSRGEFTVARDQYVRPKTGWFSDRSVCYLASGRPVITQETGFSKFIPSGAGLHGFSDLDGILQAIDRIESNYARECAAARDIAAEYFAAEKVIAQLMDRSGLGLNSTSSV